MLDILRAAVKKTLLSYSLIAIAMISLSEFDLLYQNTDMFQFMILYIAISMITLVIVEFRKKAKNVK